MYETVEKDKEVLIGGIKGDKPPAKGADPTSAVGITNQDGKQIDKLKIEATIGADLGAGNEPEKTYLGLLQSEHKSQQLLGIT